MDLFLTMYTCFGIVVFVLLMTFPPFVLEERGVEIYNSKKNGEWQKDFVLAFVCALLWLPLLITGFINMNKEK